MKNESIYSIQSTSTEVTKQLGASLAPYLQKGDIVLLSGDLGAGKTQFVQGLAAALGIKANVTSPSFNILLCYKTNDGVSLYHFDLYRLDEADQLEDIDFYETIESDGVSCIEWGKKFPETLPESYLDISFVINENDDRHIRVQAVGKRAYELCASWAHHPQSLLKGCAS